MKIINISFILTAILLFSFASANGQKFSDSDLQTILTKAAEKTVEYSDKFRNLSAEEIKNFEIYDETGKLEKRKTILSTLIVYEPADKKGYAGEFRNVRKVDGKIIKDGEKRTTNLFAKLADAKSFSEELEKLNREGSRYDENLSFYGMTLFQAMPLGAGIIESFKFEETARENVAGNEAVRINFQQIAVNANINIKIDAPNFLEVSNTFYRGVIWLDLKNYRILKLITELTFESPKLTEPFVLTKQEFTYQPSKFEIYLPERIIFENYVPKASKQLKLLMKNSRVKADSELKTRLTTEYKNFSKFDVTVKSD